jgi:CPA2 family monovalent cation:H+ antiporter-2
MVVAVLMRFSKLSSIDSLKTGIMLAQGSELGFALLSLSMRNGLLPDSYSQVILGSLLLSMLISPILMRYQSTVIKKHWLRKQRRGKKTKDEFYYMRDHVIICGFGRVGQNVSRILKKCQIAYLAIDADATLVNQAKLAGETLLHADVMDVITFDKVRLNRARAMVIAFDELGVASFVLQHVRLKHPKLPIFVRTMDNLSLEVLKKLGATDVVPMLSEESLLLSSRVLQALHLPHTKIQHIMQSVRQKKYALFNEYLPGENPALSFEERKILHSIVLPDDAASIGLSLRALPADIDVEVTGLRRQNQSLSLLDVDVILQYHDVLTLYGTQSAIEHAKHWLLRGYY